MTRIDRHGARPPSGSGAAPDYDPAGETLYDGKGNPITQEYLDEVSGEAEMGYNLSELTPIRGRPSLAGRGESPQVRFRVPTDLRRRRRGGECPTRFRSHLVGAQMQCPYARNGCDLVHVAGCHAILQPG